MTPLGSLGWFGIAILAILVVSILILYFQGVFRNRIISFRARNIPNPEDAHFPLAIAPRDTSAWRKSDLGSRAEAAEVPQYL